MPGGAVEVNRLMALHPVPEYAWAQVPLLPPLRDGVPDWFWPIGIALIVLWIALLLRLFWRVSRTREQSADDLRAVLVNPKELYLIGPAIVELRRRGEPLGPCWNRLSRLATSSDRMERMLGWQALQRGFPEAIAGQQYEPKHVSREDRLSMRAWLEEHAPRSTDGSAVRADLDRMAG